MKCSDARGLFVAYLDGELGASERALVDLHLRACDGCQRALDSTSKTLRHTRQSLQALAAGPSPSASAWEQLQAKLRGTAPSRRGALLPRLRLSGVGRRLDQWRSGATRSATTALLATLIAALTVMMCVPDARAQVRRVVRTGTHWMREPSQGIVLSLVPTGAEGPALRPSHLPGRLRLSLSLLDSLAAPGSGELIWTDGEAFLTITQTVSQTEGMPAGERITVQGHPAVLVTDLRGTFAPRSFERLRVSLLDSIDYTDGKQLTWHAGNLRIEMLTNLPRDELLKVAESLTVSDTHHVESPREELDVVPHNNASTDQTGPDQLLDCR